jgi:GAF domain-containing protein
MSYIIPIIIAFLTAVIGPILVEWVRSILKNKGAKTPMQEAVELNEAIDTQLSTIQEELGCDRVWLAQFHNGGHFYPTGKSIQKFSIFYEKVNPETPSVQHTYQNIPVSLFPRIFSKLYKDNEISIPSFNKNCDNCINPLVGTFAESHEAKSMYISGLQSLDDHMIGIICISYNNAEHVLTDEQWNYVRQKIGTIGTLLSEYLKTNVKH